MQWISHVGGRLLLVGMLWPAMLWAAVPAASTHGPAPVAPVAAPVSGALPDFTAIVSRNAPAVVHVEARYDGLDPSGAGSVQARRQLDLLQQLFGIQGMPVPRDPPHTALGSGFIISADGYVLTNEHVIKGASAVSVRLQDHRRLPARVVGSDATYDVALLKLDTAQPLPTVRIGDSNRLKPGQWVLAIGSPFGFDYTVTHGIVSAVGRRLGAGEPPWRSFIQTDVPINRGNSGGPLFNLQGEVVGINSQIYSNTGGYLGVAFSIPIDVAMQAADQLKRQGYVARGVLGVLVQPVDAAIARSLGLPDTRGALVRAVAAGSGAARAGLRVGDVIRGYDGDSIDDGSDLPARVAATPIGRQARLTVWREHKPMQLAVTVGTMPSAARPGLPAMVGDLDRLGLRVEAVPADPGQAVGGLRITQLGDGPAARQQLQVGDVLLQLDQLPLHSVQAYQQALAALPAGATVLLLVQRDDQVRFVAVTLPSG